MINRFISAPISSNNLSFKAGFQRVKNLAQNIDANKISSHLNLLGIENNLEQHPIISYCSALTTNIFLKLGLKPPTGIFVAPFSKIKTGNLNDAYGFCIPSNSNLCAGANELEPIFGRRFNVRTVFINSDVEWYNLDKMCDSELCSQFRSTGHFLHTFIHEFAHNIHMDHLYTRYGYPYNNNLGYKYGSGLNILNIMQNTKFVTLKNEISKRVSDYATTNPIEFVAENLTELIVKSLDPINNMPVANPFAFSAYVNGQTIDAIFKKAWKGIIDNT